MLSGYVDGSNLHDDADVIAVAGCAANTNVWPSWEADQWKPLLDLCDIEKWHHTDFIAKKRKRRGKKYREIWPEGEWLLARGRLCETFEAIKPICFGTTVKRQDYVELRAKYASLPEDPYYFLLDRCLNQLIQRLFEAPKDTGIAIYCDVDKNPHLVEDLARWHTTFLHQDTRSHYFHPEKATRQVAIVSGWSTQHIPLQAADVVAHELMSFARRHPEMPTIAINYQTGSWILERLKGQFPWIVWCPSKDLLDAEVSGKAFPRGNEPGYNFTGREGF